MFKEYLKIKKAQGPLIFLEGIREAKYGEIIEISVGDEKRLGKVVRIEEDFVAAQVFQGTSGMSTKNTSVKFTGKPFEIAISKNILGRAFNGVGKPIDGGGPLFSEKKYNINGRPINPVARKYPRNFIQTGISSIDILLTLIRGQKLPIFSGNGLPHKELAAQIVNQARISSEEEVKFAICFAAIGVTRDDGAYFREKFEESGSIDNVVMFMNYADDPVAERISTPRCALTAAEYLAFEEDMHILVVVTDVTSYCEGLREIASAREEVPSRKGYPGYLYSDLASLYERAGMLKSKKGSITFLPILTMPNDDITHPIPDLTGYITEGQVVLSRELSNNSIVPPVNVLPSLSRLMKDGIGEGFTREDHPDIANQLFSSYSKVQEIRSLAQIIGEEDLSDIDKLYMKFGRYFEDRFINQGFEENRRLEESLDIGWKALSILPKEELDRIDDAVIEKYYRK
ncbi:V/A-type H+-transporting ATPase subunit B [Dethiosulfatibacter aminovorans DSM 17477]|uniref:V-type ATP synthase beta chain n=1 Tax=Dethiosulfatibacter aminovorans DSM 17477 TaxID=1121476 RepID=A0A1M6I9T8_9FIRM|nr:V-type ATP synthase subunit B [Dethiosulfatibacter aminovorans]SHJ31155.1 V/A-type H+-transporting ATPase subunit B [Dethiosulfatibacter aminovorans DSM 17477]